MNAPIVIINSSWAIFLAYWLVSVIWDKGVRKLFRYFGAIFYFALLVAIVLLAWFPGLNSPSADFIANCAGVALCAGGIALAFWARAHLGNKWNMPISTRHDPVLVSTGPYRIIRHPLYSGMLFAMLGSVLVNWRVWLPLLFAFGLFYIYSAQKEERFMLLRLRQSYAEYQGKTKKFIPLLW